MHCFEFTLLSITERESLNPRPLSSSSLFPAPSHAPRRDFARFARFRIDTRTFTRDGDGARSHGRAVGGEARGDWRGHKQHVTCFCVSADFDFGRDETTVVRAIRTRFRWIRAPRGVHTGIRRSRRINRINSDDVAVETTL